MCFVFRLIGHNGSHNDGSAYKGSRLELFKMDWRNLSLEITAVFRHCSDIVVWLNWSRQTSSVLSPMTIDRLFKNASDWNFSRRILGRSSLLVGLVANNPLTLQLSSPGCRCAHHDQREHKRPWCRKPCAEKRSYSWISESPETIQSNTLMARPGFKWDLRQI